MENIKTVIRRLTEFNFTINMDKSKFGCSSIVLLGHVITKNGTIEIDRSKIANIDDWQRPKTGKDVERLLGFCNYFRRYFVLETIASPFHRIRHYKKIEWTDVIFRYSFRIEYVEGIQNVIPDILSRMYVRSHDIVEINEEIPKVRTISVIPDINNMEELTNIIDPEEKLRLIHKYHSQGHFGIRNVIKLIHEEEKIHWQSINEDVKKIVQGCRACTIVQLQTRGFHPLNPITASLPGDLVAIDIAYMKRSMSSEGYNYCLFVIVMDIIPPIII